MVLLLIGLALADVPDTSPETCLLEYYDVEHCESCSASFEGDEACQALGAAGRERACSTSGASVWSEIWCDPGYTEPISGPPESGGCGSKGGCATGGLDGLAAPGLALALVMALSRRRAG